MFTVFFLAFLTTQPMHETVPSISVASQLECGTSRFAVIEVSNPSQKESIFFPLSPLYTQGFTIHNVRLEVEHEGKWRLVGRGSDIQDAGTRELRPNERLVDFFLLPTLDQTAVLGGSSMRLVISYKIGTSFRQVKTGAFEVSDLPVRSDLTCPVLLNAK